MSALLCPTCGFSNPAGASACAACGTPLPKTVAAPHVLPPGTKLAGGSYTVGKVLGQGGFGITYLGSDTARRQAVAVKELFPAGSARGGLEVYPSGDWTEAAFAEARTKFRTEGEVLRRFHHPNIVGVHAVFEENRTAYLVMEYLRGRDLDVLLAERGGPLPEVEALYYVRQIAEALTVVHSAGLLHRDLKPGNILVTQAGRAVLIDFGTAREFAAERTHRMTAMLTPGYAPLEQYSQKARFGAFTDVYALSATLYHLLTAALPVASLDRIQGVELPPVRKLNPAVSEATDRAVMRGLEMQVDRRPQTAAELIALLPSWTAPEEPAEEAPPPAPRRREAAAPAAVPARPERRRPQPPAPPRERALLDWPVMSGALRGHGNWVHGVAFASDGELVASVGQDNLAILWDLAAGQARHVLGTATGPLLGALGALYAVRFDSRAARLATGGNDDVTRLWDVRSGRVMLELPGRAGNVNALAFSPDDRWLAAGCQFRQTELWDLTQRKVAARLEGHAWSVVAVDFSPDGDMLATGSEDGTVVVWDTRTRKGIATLAQHRGGVRSLHYSPDGDYLATGSDDYTVHLWDRETGRLARELAGHRAGVRTVRFSPDSQLLASAGDDMTIRFWSVPDGRALRTFGDFSGSVTGIDFSPDGRLLAAGSMDGLVRIWRLR
ncbi:MAG: WD40 repeat domain-containing serine/threonine protein kinase [Armatimonadota bacterium]